MARKLGIRPELLPRSIQFIGDIALLRLKKEVEDRKEEIGRTLLELCPRIKTVCILRRVEGEFRLPKVEVVAGNGTETVHCENDVYFNIDVAKFMFSKGNLYERLRIPKLVSVGEVVVDMFAGIGYFALQIAKHSLAREVIAIEKNPEAYHYLLRNIALNSLTNVTAVLGDCREVAKLTRFRGVGDRILMGYFISPFSYLEAALLFAKPEATLHFHFLSRKEDLEVIVKRIVDYIDEFGFRSSLLRIRKIKSFAPRVYHYVADVAIRKR